MTAVTSAPELIQEEEVSYKSAVSEATFNKIAGTANYILQNASDYVGQLECTMLTEAQFATIKSYDHTETDLTVKKWVIVDGQDVTGSDWALLTGITTLASMKTNGAFPRQSDSDANINAYQSSQNLSHNHSIYPDYTLFSNSGSGSVGGNTSNNYTQGLASIANSGGSEARPNAVKVNYFLRINS